MKEANVHYQVAQYLKHQYPQIIFRTDFAAGIKMTMGQAVKHKGLQSGKAYPDLFIAQPVRIDSIFHGTLHNIPPTTEVSDASGTTKTWWIDESASDNMGYFGLFLELKRDGTVLKRPKDARAILKGETKLRRAGDWFDDHVEEQAMMLERLRRLGYKAEFAAGFDSAKKIIDEYLK